MNKKFLMALVIFISNNATFASDSSDRELDKFYEVLSYGHINFAGELLNLNPRFQYELNDENQTLLHLSAQHHFPERSIQFLIDRGWDVNAQDIYGKTPFMYALEEPYNEDIINALYLSNKINFLLQDKRQKTIIDYAMRHYSFVIDKLKEKEEIQKYFAILPDFDSDDVRQKLEKIEKEVPVRHREFDSYWKKYEPNPSILIYKKPQSELHEADWQLDGLHDNAAMRLKSAEDKKRILNKLGQSFENGAGI